METSSEQIAIIGIGCRFPGGANGPEEFWKLLADGVDAITEVPPDRWNLNTFYDPDPAQPGRTYARYGGFIEQIDGFDPRFFGISPREAVYMDPQQRMLLEVTWEALEDAGMSPEKLSGSPTGVFIGLFVRDYEQLQLNVNNRRLIDSHTGVGVSMSIAANRISYAFNFTGPSMAVDTACSSSLVAVHLACQSLRNGECSLALAGGANALLRPEMTIATSKASMLSREGHSKSFDAEADGYVRAEGAGIVVLKKLSSAVADGDPVYAVIRGSAVNQDGRTSGLTVPNGQSQEAALRASLGYAGVSPGEIQYVEAHGTGTAVGDPVEALALGNVLGGDRSNHCWIGSVKSNIGHLEAAAGIAGLIKTVLAIQKQRIPPNLHFNTPNPRIPFADLRLAVCRSAQTWPAPPRGPRLACVNSFGFGGTNANVVVAEAPSPPPTRAPFTSERPLILPVSARDPEALTARVRDYLDFIKSKKANLADMCYSASLRSGHHDYRLAVVAHSATDLADQLQAYLNKEILPTIRQNQIRDTAPKPAFAFSGMGPQWWAMGRELSESEPVFNEMLLECDRLLTPLAGWSLLKELSADEAESRINETRFAQPAIFALQVGLNALLQSWGIIPAMVFGHSVGEVAAAHVSGALSLADAVRIIYHRSRLQQTTAGRGRMLAIGISAAKAESLIASHASRVSIAAINGPDSVTLSGEGAVLEAVADSLERLRKFHRFLNVEVPYHGPQMDPLEGELLSALADIQPRPTKIPFHSTVTGQRMDGTQLDARYWWQNIRRPVQFAGTVADVRHAGAELFLEIGPHPVLNRSISECLKKESGEDQDVVLSSLHRGHPEQDRLLAAAGQLYTLGFPIAWEKLQAGRFIRLPRYPWQKERYWHESEESRQDRIGPGQLHIALAGGKAHPLLGRRFTLAPSARVWEADINPKRLTYLNDHRVGDTLVYPGAAYIEMALAAAVQIKSVQALEAFEFSRAFILNHDGGKLQAVLSSDNTFEIYSQTEARKEALGAVWSRHANCRLRTDEISETTQDRAPADIRESLRQEIEPEDFYRECASIGLRYGPAFRGIMRMWRAPAEALTRLRNPYTAIAQAEEYHLHPVLLDACFQTLIGTISRRKSTIVYLPVEMERLIVHESPGDRQNLYCHAKLDSFDDSQMLGTMRLLDESGRVLIDIQGFRCRAVGIASEDSPSAADFDEGLYEMQWLSRDLPKRGRALPASDNWLIFADGGGVAGELAARLEAADQNVYLVVAGTEFERLDGTNFRIAPERPLDFERLLDQIPPCAGIIHLWSLDSHLPPESVAEDGGPVMIDAQRTGVISILHLVQALTGHSANPRLCLVTGAAQMVDNSALNLQQAPVWGLGEIIAREHPELHCIRLDIASGSSAAGAEAIFRELESSSRETQVAWRAKQRHVARLVRGERTPANEINLDGRAIYLITGGLGDLGLRTAQWMIAKGARNLVLTGRRATREKQSKVAALKSTGARVTVVQADISDPANVRHLFAKIAQDAAPLRGIIHAAGVLDDGALSSLTASRFLKVMAPKMLGAWYLHTHTRDIPLDFFICFSSIASMLGSPGQANYAAGNAFMDALAHHRRAQGKPSLSINWGPWSEIGMAANNQILNRLRARGLGAMSPETALHMLGRLLFNADVTRIGVGPIDWPRYLEQFMPGPPPILENFIREQPGETETALIDTLRGVPAGERPALLREYIKKEVAGILAFGSSESIKPQQKLFDLGLDSLMSVELKNRLEANLRLSLSTTLLFDHPTVNDLVEYLDARLDPSDESEQSNVAHEGEVETLLTELENLSAEELGRLLAEELADSQS